MPLKSTDLNQILNIASSGHVQTIQNAINNTSPSKEHQNHLYLKLCHPPLRVFLMPSNLTDLYQILNIAYADTQNIIKDTSTNQEH